MVAPEGAPPDLSHLIDRLEEMILEARKVPLGGGVMVDRRRLLDLVDELRVAAPQEGAPVAEAVSQEPPPAAPEPVARTQDELEARLSEEEVVRAAKARAEEIVRQGEERARQIVQEAEERAAADLARSATAASQQLEEADRYALELLRKLEGQIQAFLENVRASVGQLEEKQP